LGELMGWSKFRIKLGRSLIALCLATPTLPIGLLTLISIVVPNFECLALLDILGYIFLVVNPLLGFAAGIVGFLMERRMRWGVYAAIGLLLNVIYIPIWMLVLVGMAHARPC
jgi:hypothetical protein